MPDTRSHRGAHPEDERDFAEAEIPKLREAVAHHSWLLTRGYAEPSALSLVGDRLQLRNRQRQAVKRCSCADAAREGRLRSLLRTSELSGETLAVDAFNVLTTLETALGGGVLLAGREGAVRDLQGVHGSWRRVEETMRAIELLGDVAEREGVTRMHWFVDRPVSNSGRLKGYLLEVAERETWDWKVELCHDPDREIARGPCVALSADSRILDTCRAWANLTRPIVEDHVENAWLVDLG